MKKLMLLWAICCISSPVLANSKPSTASVEELLSLTEAHKLSEVIRPQLEASIRQSALESIAGKSLDNEQKEIFETIVVKTNALVKKETAYEKMKPLFVETYKVTFTQEEVDALLEFYKTELGQTLIQKMPLVNQSIIANTQTHMASLMPAIQQISDETVAEVKAKRKK